MRYNAGTAFPWHIYAVPNALFLLTALFLWLDFSKYSNFLMLFISGKFLCIFSEISSVIAFFISKSSTVSFESKLSNSAFILTIAFLADLTALVIALVIFIGKKKQKPAVTESGSDTVDSVPGNDAAGQGGA